LTLAIETSCDDTCAAVMDCGAMVRSNVISSQGVHDRYGGVVPEIASRHHLELINLVVEQALSEAGAELEDIELIAATQGPGLVGALLVGLSSAKAIAAARELPFVAVDHLQGHVAANFILPPPVGGDGVAPERAPKPFAVPARALESSAELSVRSAESSARSAELSARRAESSARPAEPLASPIEAFEPPFVCLIASGGHTLLTHVTEHDGYRVLGSTLDDAAGEAFDKGARMLGLGYPGGPALERLAADGDPRAFVLPGSHADRARGGKGAGRRAFEQGLDMSFAGLKTALLYKLREMSPVEVQARASDLAASYQAAIVDNLLTRAAQALRQTGLERLAVGGGVAANGELRRRLKELDASVHVPGRELCTDNAAMIAAAAQHGRRLSYPAYLGLDAYATGERPR
jgi:N6-L-threonylcarbamoyladenine synthase